MTEKELRLHGMDAEQFYMFKYKVDPCQKRYAHDWTSCLYAHSGESARRRDPRVYKPIPCPESKGGNPCPRGDSCKYAHNDFEYWLHPARYKTEYCKQGPSCSRKICFFAHRPEEIRKAPSVVYTNQGPFLDSETTARNKQRQQNALHGISSPWGPIVHKTSATFNNNFTTSAAPTTTTTPRSACCQALSSETGNFCSAQLTTLPNPQMHLNTPTSNAHALLYSSGLSMTNNQHLDGTQQGFEDKQDNNNLLSKLQRQNEDHQSLNNLQNAVNAMTLSSAGLQTSLSDLSPLASQTPTTPWSAVTSFPYANPFGTFNAAEHLGNTELLSFLQGLQNHSSMAQTPRSLTNELTGAGGGGGGSSDVFPYSWSNDLINLAQIVSSDMSGNSELCSSISDGAVYVHQRLPPFFTTSTNAAVGSELGNNRP